MKKFIQSFTAFWGGIFTLLISLVLVAVVLAFGGWVIQVLFGRMTTTEYLQLCGDMLRHPSQTPAGHWFRDALERVKS